MSRPRKTELELQLSGSRRAKASTIEEAVGVEVEQTKPQRPGWLTGEVEIDTWNKLCEHLASEKMLSAKYQNLMIRYCTAWSRWVQLVEHIDEVGETIETTTKSGITRYALRPETKILHELSAELLVLEREFEMTPKSRGQLPSQPASPPNPKLRFFATKPDNLA